MINVSNVDAINVPASPIILKTRELAARILSLNTERIRTFIWEPMSNSPLTSSSLTETVASPNRSGNKDCHATVPSL